MRLSSPCFALLSVLGLACGNTPEPMAEHLELPPPPENGMQIVLPVIKGIEPGTSHEYCTWTDKTLENDVDVKSALGLQTKIGHHAILFYTTKFQPAGTTRECTDDDMATFRFAVGSAGEGMESVAPGNLVYHLPKGSQLVVNHHYLNASPTVQDGQSAIQLKFAEPGQSYVRAGHLAFVNTDLRIPPGRSTMDINCKMIREEKIWKLMPHMHRWGQFTTVDVVIGGKSERMFSQTWDESFTFHPPEFNRDLSAPLVMKPGDQVKVHCEWDNTTGKPMTFGMEMCVAFGHTINSDNKPNIACDNGDWTEF